jgi:two-component system, NarL family, nitrate/nitrite response regulator NarL
MRPQPPRERRVRVLTADTQPLFQDSLSRALERCPSMEIVGDVGDTDSLIAGLEQVQPDVAVIDDSLYDPARIAPGGTRLVLLAGEPAASQVFDSIERGVAGYLSRNSEPDALRDAIVRVAAGEAVLDPSLQTGVAREIRLRASDGRPVLSPREQQILELIATGLSSPAIARELQLGNGTVKTHILHLYEKLGVGERAAAVAEAMRQGLLE